MSTTFAVSTKLIPVFCCKALNFDSLQLLRLKLIKAVLLTFYKNFWVQLPALVQTLGAK